MFVYYDPFFVLQYSMWVSMFGVAVGLSSGLSYATGKKLARTLSRWNAKRARDGNCTSTNNSSAT